MNEESGSSTPQPEFREPHYWVRPIGSQANGQYALRSEMTGPGEPGEVLLPNSDPRVQDILVPRQGRKIQCLTLTSPEDLNRLAYQFERSFPQVVYRGQGDWDWGLQTPLERDVHPSTREDVGLEQYEYRIATEAQRRLQHFIAERPDEDDLLSWLALLRHEACPTRLLDVTRSLFVALHFAVRDPRRATDAALWIFSGLQLSSALNDWMRRATPDWLRNSPFPTSVLDGYNWPIPRPRTTNKAVPTIESLRFGPPVLRRLDPVATLDAAMRGFVEQPGVMLVEPFWMSRRMDAQQGAFLVPFNVRRTFEENLVPFLGMEPGLAAERPVPTDPDALRELWSEAKVTKVRIPFALHQDLRVRLHLMNVRDLTLFPDAGGALSHLTALVPVVPPSTSGP